MNLTEKNLERLFKAAAAAMDEEPATISPLLKERILKDWRAAQTEKSWAARLSILPAALARRMAPRGKSK